MTEYLKKYFFIVPHRMSPFIFVDPHVSTPEKFLKTQSVKLQRDGSDSCKGGIKIVSSIYFYYYDSFFTSKDYR